MMRPIHLKRGILRGLLHSSVRRRYIHHFNAPRLSDLVLVRHGESEGNVARELSIKGDHSLFSGEFKNRHSSKWRLTDRGREQSEAAGEWLRTNDLTYFDRYLVSEYLRAMETAARMNLPDAQWYAEMLLRERDWGQMDLMSEDERSNKMYDELKRRDLDGFYYAPPGGESMAAVAQRADRLLGTLHRECPGKKVLVVCHGEFMWSMRTRLERMSQDTFRELQMSGRMVDQLHNAHILQYTRKDPSTGKVAPFFTHMRSVCPWNEKLSPKGWIQITRPVYDNEMMLAIAERVPRMIVSVEYIEQTYRPEKTVSSSSLSSKSSSTQARTRKAQSSKRTESSRLIVSDATNRDMAADETAAAQHKTAQPMNLKKVLIVNKMTRFEHEERLYGNTG
jgi:NAD+ kinase